MRKAQERAACELAELLQLAPASVSQHLKVLRNCGLLVLDKRGRCWTYRAPPATRCGLRAALARLEESFDGT